MDTIDEYETVELPILLPELKIQNRKKKARTVQSLPVVTHIKVTLHKSSQEWLVE